MIGVMKTWINYWTVMRELREKCPWDQQQTPQSLTKYAIEEAYEVEASSQGRKYRRDTR